MEMTNEEIICKKVSEHLSGKDWHVLTENEKSIVSDLELAVIDPWPRLLAQLLPGGCFLNRLPLSACVVTTWADPLYVRCRNDWRARGLREKMNDVKTLVQNLELLP